MVDQWFYGSGADRHGPFSSRQLHDLAVAGSIQLADTVWKEGTVQGVLAHKVKNLFPPALAAAPEQCPPSEAQVSTEEPLPETATIADISTASTTTELPSPMADAGPEKTPAAAQAELAVPAPEVKPPPAKKPNPPETVKKGRATALKGAIIVNQDGFMVSFKKKCSQCGHEDTGRSRMPIRNGTTRATYFCPVCRKVRPVEIHGMK